MANSLTEIVTVGNEMGLHARPAAQLVHIASRFGSTLRLRRHGHPTEADCRSVLALLMLAATKGSQVEITATGDDADAALQAICSYFKANFNEK